MTTPFALPDGWSSWPQKQRDDAYDNTGMVADSAEQIAARVALSEAFDLGSGRVEEGEPADLVLMDLSGPWAQPGHDLISDLVYAAHGCVVHTTICDGAVLMHDHVVEVVDQDEVMREAREAARELVG